MAYSQPFIVIPSAFATYDVRVWESTTEVLGSAVASDWLFGGFEETTRLTTSRLRAKNSGRASVIILAF